MMFRMISLDRFDQYQKDIDEFLQQRIGEKRLTGGTRFMAIEYLGLSEINGPLVVLEGVKNASYEEIVEFHMDDGTTEDRSYH